MKEKKTTRILAIIIIAIIMAVSIGYTAWVLHTHPDVYPSTKVTTTMTAERENSHMVVNSMDKSVLLVDRSGSTAGTTIAGSNYESVMDFSSGIGVTGGYSEIAEAIQEELEAGYLRIGVITDMEEHRSDGGRDWKALKGAFSNVEIKIYLTQDYEDAEVLAGMQALESILDKSTCTLRVYDSYGAVQTQFGGFDNFDYEAYLDSMSEEVPVEIVNTYSTNSGNSIPYSDHILEREFWFLVFCIMAILLLALVRKPGNTTTPATVGHAIHHSDGVLLDGSSSVSSDYKKMVSYCENEGKHEVIRFAGEVKEISLKEAKKIQPGGSTSGYEAMKLAYERGMRRIMVVTDGAFTDSSDVASGVKFEKIYFVGTTMNVEHLEMFADEIEKIQI